MKTLTTFVLGTTLAIGMVSTAQANPLTDELTTMVSTQISELKNNIKQQARLTLEQTVNELLFTMSNDVAKQQVNTAKVEAIAVSQDNTQATKSTK